MLIKTRAYFKYIKWVKSSRFLNEQEPLTQGEEVTQYGRIPAETGRSDGDDHSLAALMNAGAQRHPGIRGLLMKEHPALTKKSCKKNPKKQTRKTLNLNLIKS